MNKNGTKKHKGNVLVVDDTQANLRLLAGMLADQGYKVRPVPNGKLALRAAQASPPDLILLDINMPDLDGYEVCQALKADPQTEEIPVIFISALDEILDKVKAFEVGGVDYITKPFQFEEVLARLETHLSLRQLQQKLQKTNEELAAEVQERKRAEESLREYAAELEARNEELDAFAGTVAHDLRSPLTPIVGTADLLLRMYEDELDERGGHLLQRLKQNGQRMAEIISALLMLARLRDEEAHFDEVDMAVIVAESLEQLEADIKAKEATLEQPESWPTVIGYDTWLKEVWVNYITNALKYGGSPPEIELGWDETETGLIRFWVKDNGPGITAEDRQKLFAPFTRLEGGQIEGHGLGLSIVKRIIKKLNGDVGVESELNQGSTFWFTLPTS